MLHLLPFRRILTCLLVATALAVLFVVTSGWLGEGSLFEQAGRLLRYVAYFDFGVGILLFIGWRFIPGIQQSVFPDLAGEWTGRIRYMSERGSGETRATLLVEQTILRMRLFLETSESTSETLVVYPERDPDFARYRLFYIYENRRKEGVQGEGVTYRGTAVMRVEGARAHRLAGDYFTEQRGVGTVEFEKQKPLNLISRIFGFRGKLVGFASPPHK